MIGVKQMTPSARHQKLVDNFIIQVRPCSHHVSKAPGVRAKHIHRAPFT